MKDSKKKTKKDNEFKLIEVFNPAAKNIEDKMKEVFNTYLTEKIVNERK